VKTIGGTVAAALSVAAAFVGGTARTEVVSCDTAISQGSQASSDPRVTRLVLGRVWLPKPSTVIDLSPVRAGENRFAKWGLEVRAGRPVVLAVPPSWRRTYSLAFAADGRAVRRVRDGAAVVKVHSCAGLLGRWNRYAGGYEVRRGMCIPLIVRAGGRTERIRLSVGRRCPTTG
jgi:hypothetical protein